MTAEIRELLPEESHWLKAFLYEAVFVPEGAPPPPKSVVEEPGVRVYIEDWGRPGDLCLAALSGGQMAGAAWARVFSGDARGYGFIDAHTPEIAVSLFKPYRAKGIGTVLMRALMKELRAAGYVRASLSVHRDNPARRLYKRLGFCTLAHKDHDELMVIDLPHNKRDNGD